MTDDDKMPVDTDGSFTRRRALQFVSAGGMAALAGCTGGGDPCDLALTKEHSGGTVTYGSTTEFELTVCNEGDEECTDTVTVTDNLPAGTTFDSISGSGWAASASGNSVTCEHSNSNGLGSGDCLPTLTLTLEVGQPSAVGPEIANCASLGDSDENTANNRACAKVPVELDGECDLTISKTYDGDVVTEGSAATFQIEVCNEGDGVCTDAVTVVDGLPSGVTFGSGAGSGWTISQSGGSVVATHDNSAGLDPGECLSVLELTVNVGSMSVTGDAIRNCATLKVEDANVENNQDCVTVPVEPGDLDGECDLSVRKNIGADAVIEGTDAVFEVTVCNEGDGICDGPVTVVDGLPSGVEFDVGAGTGWSFSESNGIVTATHANGGGLQPGECLPTMELNVQIGSMEETGDQIRNCATLKVEDANPDNNQDCVSVPVQPGESDGKCDLSISKTYDGDVVTEGTTATFQIEVCNGGDGVCGEEVTVVDGLPAGVTFDSASGTGWSASQSGGSVVATHANGGGLNPGACLPVLELTFNIGSMSETGDQIRNCATLKVEDVNPDNNQNCVSVPVQPAPGECDLAITKTHAGGDVVTAESTTTFDIVVCNQGDGDCDEQVTVTDDLPDGVTFDSASGTDWSVSESGGVVTATHANSNGLAPGDCLPALSLNVNVGSIDETGDQITNCASLDGDERNDRSCVTMTVTEPVDSCNALEIEKVAATQFTYGQQEEYEIRVHNPTNGPCDAQITVTDDLPDGISYVSHTGSGWNVTVSGGVVTATHPNTGGLAAGDWLPTLTLTVDVLPANQFPGGSDAVQNCAQLIVNNAVVHESCITHVITNV